MLLNRSRSLFFFCCRAEAEAKKCLFLTEKYNIWVNHVCLVDRKVLGLLEEKEGLFGAL